MKNTHAIQRVLDLVIGRRIVTTCWLSAGLGISIMQMRLLAQAWLVLPHALAPACLMSAWILGSLVGSCLSGDPRVWGSSALALTLLWLISPSLVSWHLSLGLVSPALMSMAALSSMAVFLGASSTAWLAQQRSWPAVEERLALARSLVGLTVGLVVAWMLPAFAGPIALTCCLPLLALDFLPPGRAPLSVPEGVAASLGATHTLNKLAWLLGGQLVILVLGTGWLCAARNVIGFPGRLVPGPVRSRVRTLALCMPVAMAGGLVALGLPFLQTPWWLAVSLAGYTLAGALWGILLTRLRPAFGVAVAAPPFPRPVREDAGYPATRPYRCARGRV